MKPFEEKFGKKILVKCNDLSFNLQSCVAENEEGPTTNVNNSSSFFSVNLVMTVLMFCWHYSSWQEFLAVIEKLYILGFFLLL